MSKKISLQCTNCDARLAANPSHIGRQLRCPKCGTKVEVTSTGPEYTSTPFSIAAAQFSGMLTPPQLPDIHDLQFETGPELRAKPTAGWQTHEWLPTLFASIAIAFCGVQSTVAWQSANAESKALKVLTARLENAEESVVSLQMTIAQLQQNAEKAVDASDAEKTLNARLWRAQDAIDGNAEQIAGIVGALDKRQHRRTTSERRIFESAEAEEEAKQIALAFKKIADAERERKRAEARMNAVKK